MYAYRQCRTDRRRIDEHRLVMEQGLGRRLSSCELVHHVNGDTRDNRPDNLTVVSPKQHAVEHGRWKHSVSSQCAVCGTTFTPQPTKRGRKKTCSKACRYTLTSLTQRRPGRPRSKYRDGAYPSEIASRRSPKRS